MTQPKECVLLDSGGPSYVIRAITLTCMIVGVILIASAFWVVNHLTKIDGTLEPLGARLTLAALMLLTGMLMSVGLWIFIRLYVVSMVRRDTLVDVTTSRVFYNHTQQYVVSDFLNFRDHSSGGFFISWFFSNTPFDALHPRGHRFPYILDCQIERFDAHAIAALVKR